MAEHLLGPAGGVAEFGHGQRAQQPRVQQGTRSRPTPQHGGRLGEQCAGRQAVRRRGGLGQHDSGSGGQDRGGFGVVGQAQFGQPGGDLVGPRDEHGGTAAFGRELGAQPGEQRHGRPGFVAPPVKAPLGPPRPQPGGGRITHGVRGSSASPYSWVSRWPRNKASALSSSATASVHSPAASRTRARSMATTGSNCSACTAKPARAASRSRSAPGMSPASRA
jgi:hypothetical protein